MSKSRPLRDGRLLARSRRTLSLELLALIVCVVGCGEDSRESVASDSAVSMNADTLAADASTVAPTVNTPVSGLLDDLVWDVAIDGTEVCVIAESIELGLQLERNCIETSGVAAGAAGGAATGRSDFPSVWSVRRGLPFLQPQPAV